MAISLANTATLYRGPHNLVYTELTFDAAYVNGGYTVNATDVGLQNIRSVFIAADSGYHITWTPTSASGGVCAAGKVSITLQAVTATTSASVLTPIQPATGTSFATLTVSLMIWGKG